MEAFWRYFEDFAGAHKIEDITKSKNGLAEVFQITPRCVITKKNWGLG